MERISIEGVVATKPTAGSTRLGGSVEMPRRRFIEAMGAAAFIVPSLSSLLANQPRTEEKERSMNYQQIAIPADSFARAVCFAISQPEDVDINEILFRPTQQEV